MNRNPLVSIIVVSYNSFEYILETLESAKNQTYRNIELIISDDCSTDKTVEACGIWLDENKERFLRTEIISTDKNTGVSANANRGFKAANGEWLKFIAGDDKLKSTCIEDFIDFVSHDNLEIQIVHSNMTFYKQDFKEENLYKEIEYSANIFNSKKITAREQYLILLRKGGFIGAPSVFISKLLLTKMNGWDEDMPYEDLPMFLKVTEGGYKIHFLNKSTVCYRIHGSSAFNNSYNELIFNEFFLKDNIVYSKYIKDHLSLPERFFERFEFLRKKLFLRFGLNKQTTMNKILNKPFKKLYSYYGRIALRKILIKIKNIN